MKTTKLLGSELSGITKYLQSSIKFKKWTDFSSLKSEKLTTQKLNGIDFFFLKRADRKNVGD